jgi:von Willebrand factor type A domain
MKRLIQTLVSTVVATVALIGAGTRTASADEQVLVVLDVTGSMTLPSIPGKTRLQVAKDRATAFLSAAAPADNEYALWFFEGATFHPIYTFADHRTRADVIAAIAGATTGGSTPLAHSVCAAVDELINYKPLEFHPKRILLETDGEENNSPTLDQCFGPPSATIYPTLTAGSWQWKVRNKACTGDASIPGLCAGGVPPGNITLVMDVDLLFDFVPTFSARAIEHGEGTLSHDRFAVIAPPPNADAAFFSGLAHETHGKYTGITPSTPPAVASPIPGDANADGCVTIQDRALVLQQFGTPGNGTDFNHDGIVNTFDLQTVLQNFGRCSP